MKHFSFLIAAHLGLALGVSPALAQTLTRVANVDNSGNLGLAASGSTVYVTGASFKLSTYNFGQPAAPVLLNAVDTSMPYPRKVVVGGTKAYVLGYGLGTTRSSTIRVFDVSQPATPVGGSTAQLGAPDFYLAANGTLVCVVSTLEAKLWVYDASLTLLSSVAIASQADGISLNGTAAYVRRGGQTDVYNLAVATAPVRATTISGYLSVASGNLAFGINPLSNTLQVYDCSNPLLPVLTGSIANNGGTLLAASGNRVYTTGQYAEIGGSTSRLQAFDVSNPSAPTLLATAAAGSTARALAANGNTVYLTDSRTVQAYTLTGVLAAAPAASTATGFYPNPAHGTLTLAQVPVNTSVSIYDATGRLCLQTSTRAGNTLDISSLPGGLYVARVGATAYRLLVD
jgi:hypothetical protein